MKDKILHLKNIGRAISNYGEDCFISKYLSSREAKLLIYLWARDFESKRNEEEDELDDIIKCGEEKLKFLKLGDTIQVLTTHQ